MKPRGANEQLPMEFASSAALPTGPWQYEPKWDGFRCLAFRDGDAVELISKKGTRLGRYFPEVVAACRALGAKRFVLDGEIVMRSPSASFDDLLERIHPAATRTAHLARTQPTVLVAFDLLVDPSATNVARLPLKDRRSKLEAFARRYLGRAGGVRLCPATTSRATAQRWLERPGSAMDGVIAKDLRAEYRAGRRDGGMKVKRKRSADCVVGGFRYASKGGAVGSLLLGLYDKGGKLHHVGHTSSFSLTERKALVQKLKPLIKPPGFTGTAPGGPSRWSTDRTDAWEPLAPRLVVEVVFDRVTNDRIRHGARFLRWRPDKPPSRCTMDQLS